MSHAFFKHVLTFPDFTFFNIDPTTLDAIKLSRGCFCTLQLLDSYWYRLILYIVYQALNKYDGSTLFLLTTCSFKHLPKEYEWSNRNIGRFLVYGAWWLVCQDTEFFLEKKTSPVFREKIDFRWIYNWSWEHAEYVDIYIYTYDIRCGFITFIQFVFFITCFSSKCWRFVGQKTLPIISSFGGSVSVIFTSSLDDWKTQSETNVWY